jgi:hypothetical protein
LVTESGGGEVVAFSAANVTKPEDADLKGGLTDFKEALASATKMPHWATFSTNKDLNFFIRPTASNNEFVGTLKHTSEHEPTKAWVDVMARVARRSVELSGIKWAAVTRFPNAETRFVPEPPFARTYHLITVTEAEVVEAYDDPALYWKAWDKIEKIGDLRICTRCLDNPQDLKETNWLAYTFEVTMALIRNAKPKRTIYNRGPIWDPQFAPWWEYGDFITEEKAGFPALAPVGYDPETKILELTGYISKAPLQEGGPEPRRVLMRELYSIRIMRSRKLTPDDKPLEEVHVIWPQRWMAMSERRPLIDMGARVFYLDGDIRVEVF